MLDEFNQSQKNRYCIILLICGTYGSQIHRERKQSGGFPRLGEGGNGKLVFNGYTVSVLEDDKVLEMKQDCGDCRTV